MYINTSYEYWNLNMFLNFNKCVNSFEDSETVMRYQTVCTVQESTCNVTTTNYDKEEPYRI